MKIAIIDGDSVLFSIGHGIKLLNEDGTPIREDGKRFVYRDKTPEELKESADFCLNTILQDGGFTHYILYVKGNNTTTHRLAVNPDYKGNRNKEQPKWWDFVLADLFTRWNANIVHDIEVDDAVNITRLQLKDSFIVAIDSDLLGLQGTHYQWRVTGDTTGKWVTVSSEEAITKFWKDMIVGQVGDNIKGIPGKGEAFWNTYTKDKHVNELPLEVFKAYSHYLTLDKGIKEFYKNYVSLKILESYEGFITPIPTEVKKA